MAEKIGGYVLHQTRKQLAGIGEVFSSPVFWRIAPWATLSQAAYLAIQGLWSGPWMRDAAGYDRSEVAQVLLLVAVAMTAGYLLLGLLDLLHHIA